MDYGPLGQGRGSAYAVHDIFYYDLVGQDPLNHEAIWQKLRMKQRHLYNFTETIWSNLDVALWDIKGKVAGLPIAVLLGKYRDRVPLYSTCSRHRPSAQLRSSNAKSARNRARAMRGSSFSSPVGRSWTFPGCGAPGK